MDVSKFLLATIGIDAAMFAYYLACSMLASCPFAYIGITYFGGLSAFGRGKLNDGMAVSVDGRIGFIIMESTAFLCVPAFLSCTHANSIRHRLLLFGYVFHYVNRTFIYPSLMINPKPIPLTICFAAFLFNIWNGTLQGMYIGTLDISEEHFYSLPFIVGLAFFVIGFYINNQCDEILRSLRRKPKKKRNSAPTDKDDVSKRYSIPYGNMYDYVSCGNYFGEIVEWGGFALLTQSYGAFVFFLFTMGNLIPNALLGHQWYRKTFPKTYPPNRKAIIPFIL